MIGPLFSSTAREARHRPPPRFGGYAAALALVGAAAAAAMAVGPELTGANLVMVFLAPVLLSAVVFGLGPALLAATAAAVTYNFFFIEPRLTFLIAHPADLVTFVMFFAVALATGWLAGRERDQALEARRHAARVGALLDASRALAGATTTDQVARVLVDHAAAAGAGAVVVLAPLEQNLSLIAGPDGLDRLSAAAEAAARRAFETGEAQSSETPAGEGWRFEPLGAQRRIAVFGVRDAAPGRQGEQGEFLAALMRQGALALERAELGAAIVENQALRRADELRSALINSISHDFRTPLSTVLGSATTLLEYEGDLKPSVRRDLLDSIREEAQRLNRYIGDLLDMARLEAGALRPRREWTDVRAAASSALDRLGDRLGDHKVALDFARDLSRVRLDRTLLEQAILNILENAVTYSPKGSRIELSAHEDPGQVVLSIEDEGPGLPPDRLESVFEKFRRVGRGSDRGEGLGLGLYIARGFIESMGGRVAATSPVARGRGARFVISLPKAVRTPKDLL